MSPLEVLLLFLALTWMVTDPERYWPAEPALMRHERYDAERRTARAERDLRQLTDLAILAMVAEARRHLPDAP